MAQAQSNRPMSPHLSIWRWGPAMAVSILHRAAGEGMAFVGIPVFLWWLAALAGGPESYATFLAIASAWYGQVVLIGLSWAFFEHLSSGLRHFVLDVGAGYELDTNNAWSWAVPAIAIVLTALFWAAIYLR
ncbi:succinate dehydrogenase, cytochrome b556 subunit [Novosphingobium sp. Gsoil 351]|uniref:succinate dehydrogenase, cytochrome b556 subunit n=1 Tax=Novosphingobium sp. Gsoil 351 TaxID=2675225 RepID=UPI0012B4D1A9|nr:succinate dehydrogenase, cytochrome b556 subunit [Novosphingobium sp. Gsoil 351]QGN53834.1 succinate dehydrogenase, cytochrome b556 subunit [Novosphingobium sp. Gsoil 351]